MPSIQGWEERGDKLNTFEYGQARYMVVPLFYCPARFENDRLRRANGRWSFVGESIWLA